jgi:hypothetical protein
MKLEIKTVKTFFTTSRKSFTAYNLLDVLVEEYGFDRNLALLVAGSLQDQKIIKRVEGETAISDANDLFRLQADEQTYVLNVFRVWTDRVDDPHITVCPFDLCFRSKLLKRPSILLLRVIVIKMGRLTMSSSQRIQNSSISKNVCVNFRKQTLAP